MKYVNDPKETVTQIRNERVMYDKNGKVTVTEPLAVAHVLNQKFNDGRVSRTFYLNTINGLIYDPLGTDSNKKKNMNCLLKSVSQQTFDYYMMYLETNNSLYLTRSQRSMING